MRKMAYKVNSNLCWGRESGLGRRNKIISVALALIEGRMCTRAAPDEKTDELSR